MLPREALVHVDRGVGVPVAIDSRVSKNTRFPSSDAAAERRIECPVAPRRARGHQARGAARVSYDVRHWGPWPAAQPVSVSAATRTPRCARTSRAVEDAPTKSASKAPLPPPGPVDTSSVVAPSALIDVPARVRVARRERLAGAEEDPRAVARAALERRRERAVAARGAGREQGRGAARPLVDVVWASVSHVTSCSWVWKKTCVPSAEISRKPESSCRSRPLGRSR